jgi:hypothetical protein
VMTWPSHSVVNTRDPSAVMWLPSPRSISHSCWSDGLGNLRALFGLRFQWLQTLWNCVEQESARR